MSSKKITNRKTMTLGYVFVLLLTILVQTACSGHVTPITQPSYTTETPTTTQTAASTMFPSATNPTTRILSREDTEGLLNSITENQDACQLPCLLNFDPRQDSADELRRYLMQFGDVDVFGDYYIHPDISGSGGSMGIGVWEGGIETDTTFGYIGNSNLDYLYFSVSIPQLKQPDYWIENATSPMQTRFEIYQLSQILLSYGKPGSVYVAPFPEEDRLRPADWLPFNIALFYPEQGFFVEYRTEKEITGDSFSSCPNEVGEFTIISWDPRQTKSIHDIARVQQDFWGITESGLNEYYRSIELIMPVDKFVELFNNPEKQDCLLVPISLWPYH